jgi:serine protease AprX
MSDTSPNGSSLPPEEQPKVKEFDPLVLDRAVIALPLLEKMKADSERIELVKGLDPEKLDQYNAAIEYNLGYPGGPEAAHRKVEQLAEQAWDRAEKAAEVRVGAAKTDGDRAREQQRLDDLRAARRDARIEPPLFDGKRYGFALLHAAAIRRLLSGNDALASKRPPEPQPIVAIYPTRFQVIIDLNLEHPGGRSVTREWVVAHIPIAKADTGVRDAGQGVLFEKNQVGSQYLFARLEGRVIRRLVELDMAEALRIATERRKPNDTETGGSPLAALKFRSIFRIWPDFEISACISRSVSTVKADAAQKSFSASGAGITWAVMDSGINADHRHFAAHGNIDKGSTFHRDFTADGGGPFFDENGHGTHVAGIIAGEWPADDPQRPVAVSRYVKTGTEDVEYQETRLTAVSGMAPRCTLVSLRVLDENGKGAVSNLIAAIEHVQDINGYGRRILIHGVNMSVGYTFEPEWFACGQSPLCVEVDRLVKTGVVVVVAAGNTGYGTLKSSAGATAAGMALTINDPGNADLAITVGATHRDMPHIYGVSYFSSKGPTGDGRLKPDLVAPGEKIISCASGTLKQTGAKGKECEYVETSGTSMAAPHVSGVIAAFLSVRGEFVGQPERVKQIFLSSATDLRRDRYFQGAGLVDLMRAIQSV